MNPDSPPSRNTTVHRTDSFASSLPSTVSGSYNMFDEEHFRRQEEEEDMIEAGGMIMPRDGVKESPTRKDLVKHDSSYSDMNDSMGSIEYWSRVIGTTGGGGGDAFEEDDEQPGAGGGQKKVDPKRRFSTIPEASPPASSPGRNGRRMTMPLPPPEPLDNSNSSLSSLNELEYNFPAGVATNFGTNRPPSIRKSKAPSSRKLPEGVTPSMRALPEAAPKAGEEHGWRTTGAWNRRRKKRQQAMEAERRASGVDPSDLPKHGSQRGFTDGTGSTDDLDAIREDSIEQLPTIQQENDAAALAAGAGVGAAAGLATAAMMTPDDAFGEPFDGPNTFRDGGAAAETPPSADANARPTRSKTKDGAAKKKSRSKSRSKSKSRRASDGDNSDINKQQGQRSRSRSKSRGPSGRSKSRGRRGNKSDKSDADKSDLDKKKSRSRSKSRARSKSRSRSKNLRRPSGDGAAAAVAPAAAAGLTSQRTGEGSNKSASTRVSSATGTGSSSKGRKNPTKSVHKKAGKAAAALTTCYRSEALEELASNVREAMEGLENFDAGDPSHLQTNDSAEAGGPPSPPQPPPRRGSRAGAGGGEGGRRSKLTQSRSVREIISAEAEGRTSDYFDTDYEYDDDKNEDSGELSESESALPPTRRLSRSIFHSFNNLLTSLLELSDELELSSTFRSVDSITSVVSASALNGILAHTPVIDLVFSELRPTLMSLYESTESKTVETDLFLNRALKLVDMINEVVQKVSARQEWDVRSETCFVTLLELLQRLAYELNCDEEGRVAEGWEVSQRLRRAWTASGHSEELRTLETGMSEDVWLYRQVCYEVIMSTDSWCPNVGDLGVVCDCETIGGLDGNDVGRLNLPNSSGSGGDMADTPTAALVVLERVRDKPLPLEATMGRIIRRILPSNATSNPNIANESFTVVRSSIRNPMGRNGRTNTVAISSVPEIKTDPTALGMGGIGKTTMAAMLASHPDVRRYFKDGVAWLHVGQRPGLGLTYDFYCACLRELCHQIPFLAENETPTFPELVYSPSDSSVPRKRKKKRLMMDARTQMSELLQRRSVLLVVDDVARKRDLRWFQFPVTVLVTTRIRDLLPAADTVEIDLLEESDAIQLLVTESGHPPQHVMGASIEAKAVVRECANHPLAVKSVGRWLSLKHATAGVINSVEEIHEDVLKSIEKIARDGDFFGGNMMYEIMGLSFSPAVNGKPTKVIQLCFAAFVLVFCHEEELSPDPTMTSPVISMEVAEILFASLLQLEEDTLIEDGSLFYSQLKEATVLIPEALSALDVFKIVSKHDELDPHNDPYQDEDDDDDDGHKYLQIQHDIQQEYGEFLCTGKGALGNLNHDSERRWNGAFVKAYVERNVDCRWDEPVPDPTCRYALEMIVSHMVRADMFEEASSLLNDESFVRGRLAALGRDRGTARHVKDCEALYQKVTDGEGQFVTTVDPKAVMERSYQRLGSLLMSDTAVDDTIETGALSVEAGRAHCAIGVSLAEKRCFGQAIAHWQTGQELLVSSVGQVEPVAAVLFNTGVVYFEMNKFDKAMQSLNQCLEIRAVVHGEQHVVYAQTMQKIADIYLEMSDYGEAVFFYEKALDVMNIDPTHNRLDIGNILHSIGCVHYSRGDLDDAMKCFEESLKTMKLVIGKKHPDLAVTYQRIGNCYSDRGELESAIEQFELAIRLKKRDPDGGDEKESDILSMEGMVHNLYGRQQEGLESYEKAFRILKTKVPHKTEKIANLLHLIGCVYLIQGDYKNAMKRFEESLQTRSKVLGFVHLDVASTLFNMAFLHQTHNNFDKALKCLEEALRIRELRLPDSDKVALTHEKIGSISKIIGEHKKAELAFEEALKIRTQLHGEDHETVASVLHEMGDLMDDIGEHDEAMICFNDALDIRRRKLGDDHELVATTLYSKGFALHNQDIDDKALLCFDEALSIRKAIHGSDSKEVGDTLNIMGFLHAKRGELDESLRLLWEALRIRKHGGDLIKASDTLKNIGNVHREKQEYQEAICCYEECLDIRKTELGTNDEKVADALIALGNIKSDMDDHKGAMSSYEQALSIRIRAHGAYDEKVAAVLQNMGTMEFRSGDIQKGKELLEEYVRVRNMDDSELDADYVNVLFIIGNIHKMQGNNDDAHRCWTEAHDIFNELGLEEENPKVGKVIDNLLKGGNADPKVHNRGLLGWMSTGLKNEKVSKGKPNWRKPV